MDSKYTPFTMAGNSSPNKDSNGIIEELDNIQKIGINVVKTTAKKIQDG